MLLLRPVLLAAAAQPGVYNCTDDAPPPWGGLGGTVLARGEGGYSSFRIPGIHTLQNTLLVFAEARKYSCADFGGQHDVVRSLPTPPPRPPPRGHPP